MPTIAEAAEMSDRLAVEHVELHVANPMPLAMSLKHYGGLFVGGGAAEVRTRRLRRRSRLWEPGLCLLDEG